MLNKIVSRFVIWIIWKISAPNLTTTLKDKPNAPLSRFFEIFEKYDGFKRGHVKLKKPKQLQEILDIARALLSDIQTRHADPEIEEKQGKLEQLKSVLEM